ncbi:MAG TPA: response regulator [Candidatus Sulfomarinibacteraceae bacterium]|nr:response regulator [Candidatus Sulfomarinibacteraceae bacterium]
MSTPRHTVLLVDDEPRFRSATAKVLDRRGFVTITAATGSEALQRLAENPDVIILDIKMPGMDGLAALRELKRRAPDVPVIMLSGHGSEEAARTALREGAFDFLAKPCDIDLLAAKIQEACRGHHDPVGIAEARVVDVMIPIRDYTTVTADETVEDALDRLRESFRLRSASDSIMETGHRSLLVLDADGTVQGAVAIVDLLQAIMPRYLSAPKPTLADSIQYSPMFWVGMFTREVRAIRSAPIRDVMSAGPPPIAADATLMEAAYVMVQQGARRLAVERDGRTVGVIREQELFFEMDRIVGGRRKEHPS